MRRSPLIGAATLAVAFAAPVVAQQTTVLRAARLIDGTGAAPIDNAAIVVTGNHNTIDGNTMNAVLANVPCHPPMPPCLNAAV